MEEESPEDASGALLGGSDIGTELLAGTLSGAVLLGALLLVGTFALAQATMLKVRAIAKRVVIRFLSENSPLFCEIGGRRQFGLCFKICNTGF